MKKFSVLLLAAIMLFSVAGCTSEKGETETTASQKQEVREDPKVKSEGVTSYADYVKAADGTDVVIEGYVQATQSWADDKTCLYLQDGDGGYFVYNAFCSQDEYNKLDKGTKIKVTGQKTTQSGEIEIAEGATFEIEDGKYIAEKYDATELLSNEEELILHQNEFVGFKGLTVEPKKDADGKEYAFFYGYDNSGEEGTDSDLYFDAKLGDKTYTFCVEYYLCDENTDVYKAVQNLSVGDKINIEGFLYWNNGQSTRVTNITLVK